MKAENWKRWKLEYLVKTMISYWLHGFNQSKNILLFRNKFFVDLRYLVLMVLHKAPLKPFSKGEASPLKN